MVFDFGHIEKNIPLEKLLQSMPEDSLAARQFRKLRKQLEIAKDTLDSIACWGEGEEVTGRFDEPGSAQTARDGLKKMKGVKA